MAKTKTRYTLKVWLPADKAERIKKHAEVNPLYETKLTIVEHDEDEVLIKTQIQTWAESEHEFQQRLVLLTTNALN
jgi:hypothetical protein